MIMNKLFRLLLLSFLCLVTSSAFGVIVNGVRQKPVVSSTLGFVASETTAEFYYLYNVKAQAFFVNGNDWGTQASLGDYGLPVAFTVDSEHPGAYLFNDFFQDNWRLTFFDTETQMFVDWNNQANYRWGVQQMGNTFRLYAASAANGNPGWDNGWYSHTDCYKPNHYVGLDASAGTTALSPYLEDTPDHYIDWALVSEEAYDDYDYANYVYYYAEELRAAIVEAEKLGLDVSKQKSVYLNEQASVYTIFEATDEVKAAINDWNTSQAVASATVGHPSDCTFKIVNPRFDGNDRYTGWEGTDFGAANPQENAEHYGKTYNTYQVLTGLPKGVYAVGVKAFYRAGSSNSAYAAYKASSDQSRYARLYATCGNLTCEEPIVSPFSAQNTTRFGVGAESGVWDAELETTYYIPNNMQAAEYYMHSKGFYDNKVLVEVDDSGELTIGVRKTALISEDWSLFDDFTLLYYGDSKEAHELFRNENLPVALLELHANRTQLLVGETLQIEAMISPANAKNKKLAWLSTNASVASVSASGLVTAMNPGTAVISATTTDGSNISKSVTVTVSVEQLQAGSVVINEIMPSNVDDFVSPAYNFDGWMELYNPTSKSVSLSTLYLSDDAQNLKKWRIATAAGILPARGYKLIWFDSNDLAPQNAPFKLDVEGGSIFITDVLGNVIASQAYPSTGERNSYARKTDGGEEWGLTSMPTPEATNATSTFATEQLAAPLVDTDSRLFTGNLTVTATIPAGTTLRYTLDGSVPTLQNGQTSSTGIFRLSNTTNLRLRLFANGKLASRVTTRSYIQDNAGYILPVVSVIGNDQHLYSNEMGVMVQGTNGVPGHGDAAPWNTFMNWQRPVNFSYIKDGEMVFNQDVNMEMCGGWSRKWLPRAFKLKGNKELGGDKNLLYPFFTQKPYLRNKTLQIRNGGNDNNCRFKDPALQMIAQSAGLNLDLQSYEPVHEFVNGEYMGVLNVREPNNKDFVYANYGWDDDEIDQFEIDPDSGYIQKCGSRQSFEDLVALSENAVNEETYSEIRNLLDVDEYANYMALQFYLRNWDWPQNNTKGFRHQDHGKYRFVVFDLDGVFSVSNAINEFMGKEYYQFDQLYPVELGRRTDSIRFVTLFKNMLTNNTFRRKFIDAYCMMGGSVYEAARAEAIIRQMADRVTPAMQLERWESPWNTANNLINNLNGRMSSMVSDLVNYRSMRLSNSNAHWARLSSNVEGGVLLVNDMKVPTGQFNGYLFAPAKLKAVAPAGYVFQGWATPSTTGLTLLSRDAQWSYYDQGSLDGRNWQSPSYSENGWKKGKAPLGYNNPNVQASTQLSYAQKDVFYFRTSVQLSQAPLASDEFVLDYQADDGFVVYVNGNEAGRYNMPDGTPSYNTYALHYAQGNPDAGSMRLPAELFHKGSNTIAVEVHNESTRSSDILWVASLSLTTSSVATDFYSTAAEIDMPESDVTLQAYFRALTDQERLQQGMTPVRINEVSGSNDTYIDEYGKKGDWLELYNTTDEEVDVEGMYLTDNLSMPEKYMITKGSTQAQTKIPAHGHLLVWCDNKRATTSQGLHASFKIDGDGGVLQLMAADKSWKDAFYYGAHDARTTVGRYPDGTAAVYSLDVATIAGANVMSSYAQLTDQEAMKEAYEQQTGIKSTLASSANGFRLRYGSQQLLVKGEDVEHAVVELFTTDGRLIEQVPVRLANGTARVSVAHLPHGFYVARATADGHTRVACKFMK